ncbi:hypothetical protein [Nonomuraea sp. SYSU D8015]|uniref:hypothetical protein n=1 Tax=Nonomuraea sp. SYSU D8015 TaxID=2593644 RepID=UPI00166048EB|nr:hypothetical protein [Nonomuraea sp. SYSU D8015]
MNTTTPSPDPPPEDDVARGLAALEDYVASRLPEPAAHEPDVEDSEVDDESYIEDEPEPEYGLDFDDDEGNTSRVRKLRAEVAEAHRLLELQDDDAPLLIDTPKVRKRRRDVSEAARLHELAQDPVALAYRDAKVRRTVTVMVMAAAAIGLAVSSIGVQASVATALELKEHTFAWWAAFGVEPALSLPLLAAVAVQAYSAMRGQVVDRKDKNGPGRKLFRAEALLLVLTLVLNCWPAFAPDVDFDLLTLIVHSLGPVAAVTAVWVLPALWSVLQALPVPAASGTGRTDGRTHLEYRANAGRRYSPPPPRPRVDIDALTDRARALIAAGKLPADAGIQKIGKALGCGTGTATKVKKALEGRD